MVTLLLTSLPGAVVGLVITVLFEDQLKNTAAHLIGRIRRPNREIAGKWATYWGVTSDPTSSPTARETTTTIVTFDLKRLLTRVTGRDIERATSGIEASLKDATFLTGTWWDHTGERYQWGAFQLWWSPDGQGMIGKFIGKDSRNHINHGIWLWARDKYDLPKLAEKANNRGYPFDDLDAFLEGIRTALDTQRT
ncbi:hypothetical protein [Streptomyces cylindrosporus]|uniref:Uncharacterized protein n=1 Tax=Streptomyces cylindrosporus TaxID=2927583 RepID=A0ABS9YIK9_9ACTN|nr:hypothetical protein [Streptomyces cylindrosporus]MCI3277020.1 hypothetical protein [Streptomyces cylindrosporus]